MAISDGITVRGIDVKVTLDGDCSFAHVALTDGYVEMFTADELREIAAEMDKLDDANTEDVI